MKFPIHEKVRSYVRARKRNTQFSIVINGVEGHDEIGVKESGNFEVNRFVGMLFRDDRDILNDRRSHPPELVILVPSFR